MSESKFFQGSICDNCGNTKRYVKSYACVYCKKAINKKFSDKYKQDQIDNPKDEVCEKCGTNDWDIRGRCKNCRQIYRDKPENKERKNKRGRIYNKQYRIDNAEDIKLKDAIYRARPEVKLKTIERQTKWYEENPDKKRVFKQNRRARVMENGGSFTVNEWQMLYDLFDGYCLHPKCLENNLTYCRNGEDDRPTIHADHVVSLAKGGTSNISNIQLLCASHNSQKHAKSIDYRPYAIQYLDLFNRIIENDLEYLFPNHYFI